MKFTEWLSDHHPEILEEGKKKKKKKWIAGAVKRPGRCTPAPNPDCPVGSPQYNLAMRFKKGDIQKANLKKGKNPKGKG